MLSVVVILRRKHRHELNFSHLFFECIMRYHLKLNYDFSLQPKFMDAGSVHEIWRPLLYPLTSRMYIRFE